MKNMNVIMGCGNMGGAIVEAILQQNIYQSSDLTIVERYRNSYVEKFEQQGCRVVDGISALEGKLNLLLLAVKPQGAREVMQEIAPFVDKNTVVISIMAGISIGEMEKFLPSAQIIRTMPNTPCSVHLGMSGYCGNQLVSAESYQQADRILTAMGKAIKVDDEQMIDSITAISGSGPAYVFYLAEALQQGAQQLGFNEEQARTLASQTLLGAATLLEKSDDSAGELRKKVTSPGGTTEAALNSFESNQIKTKLIEGFQAAFDRSLELGKG